MNTKICTGCNEEKPNTEEFFRPYLPSEIKNGKTGLHVRCRECLLDAHNNWAKSNKDKVNQYNRSYRYSMANWIDTLKDAPCVDCGVQYPPYVMDFDHLPEFKKLHGIPQLINRRASKQRILEEIAKCELVCANCHRIRTMKRGQWGGRYAVKDMVD